jgi:hypothetical protein
MLGVDVATATAPTLVISPAPLPGDIARANTAEPQPQQPTEKPKDGD